MKSEDPLDQYRLLAGIRSPYPSLAEASAPKLTKKTKTMLSSIVQRLLSDSGAQINIFNLGKLSKAAEDAYMAGGDDAAIQQAVTAAIAKYRENREDVQRQEEARAAIAWEKKSDTIQIAFVDVTSETSGKAIKHDVALRIDGRGGSFRVDMATAVRGTWLPWEAIDNGKAVDSEDAAKKLAAVWVAAANKQKTLHPSSV